MDSHPAEIVLSDKSIYLCTLDESPRNDSTNDNSTSTASGATTAATSSIQNHSISSAANDPIETMIAAPLYYREDHHQLLGIPPFKLEVS